MYGSMQQARDGEPREHAIAFFSAEKVRARGVQVATLSRKSRIGGSRVQASVGESRALALWREREQGGAPLA